ncbi:beta-lactamase family protein [Amycolatopsis acidiphila]|uniref:Beta-lactamase family protein n=1 Tax=Amycolatopsis acidiphila TaxID=715473 RepID=A0A558A9I5_9PSEU|nr:serine hydrolase domain-containing protein [Amycolatopsis acidiphila]TVT20920.1 beta-lactamase family protein [Amycolatopsis acidiphila]UIJ62980.1 beta-lactamase family protein [Amycolatopsis acidiphila]
MANLDETKNWLSDRLPALLAEHGVPGAAIAVSARGEVVDHAAGVLNTGTGVEATPDSLFQVGSITKVWTTTLAMQLADEGRLELDAPLRRYLPQFRLRDEAAAAAITVRQLMCHTSGFEGDLFTDTGKGDDCVEKYVATLGDVEQLFAPGEMFSYNNAAFCVLGRVVEVLRDKPFDACLREHLFTPLGLTHAATCADEAILHRAAVGHVQPSPDEPPRPAPVWSLVRSNAPAGAALAMRPRDLVTFAQAHLDGGGTVLSAAGAEAMRERQVTLPPLGLMGTSWGLGWELYDWPTGLVLGHDGGTIGQAAFLRVVPDKDVAIALLTNGGNPIALYLEIYTHLLRELADVELPPLPKPPPDPEPFDATRYVGTYSCEVSDLTVSQDDDGRVWAELTPKGILAELSGTERDELVRLDGDTLVAREPRHSMHQPHVFLGDDGSGRARYVHTGRATRRAG